MATTAVLRSIRLTGCAILRAVRTNCLSLINVLSWAGLLALCACSSADSPVPVPTSAEPDAGFAVPDGVASSPPDGGSSDSETPDASTDDTATDSDAGAPDAGEETVDETCLAPQPGASVARLLTRLEYDLSAGQLLQTDTDIARQTFPPENEALGFDNNADAHMVSPALVEAQIEAARVLAKDAVTERLALVAPCATDGTALDLCRDEFTADFGRRAYRRPLHDDELVLLRTVFDAGTATGGASTGVEFVIRTALLSPQFLYRLSELSAGETDGEPVALSGYELAERLSYFLWSAGPDDLLLDAAAAGELTTAAGLETQARRMLADPRALDTVDSFHRQWLELDELDHIEKTLPAEVHLNGITLDTLRESWKESIQAFIHAAVLGPGGGIQALFGSQTIYVDATLGLIYDGAPVPTEGFAAWEAPDSQRAGLLTQPALMAVLAHSEHTSPIHRGVFVRDRMLCQPIDPPPPDVDVTPPDPDPNATTRERFAQHTADIQCSGCHSLIDPIGFSFEHYDHLGRWRNVEHGLPIDASGEIFAVPNDPDADATFYGALELTEILTGTPRLAECVAEHWYRFAMGRGTSLQEDGCNLQSVTGAMLAADGDITELLVAITTSEAFRFRYAETLTTPAPIDTTNPELVLPEPEDVDPVDPIDLPPGDPDPTSPIGFWDSMAPNGLVQGWALDPNQPLYEIFIIVMVDGSVVEPYQRADLPRPDVNDVTGYPGDHGFKFILPPSAMDGNPHSIKLIAVDVGDSGNFELNGSPKTFQTSSGLPKGHLDTIAGATVKGWSFDPDDPVSAVTVKFYLDGPSWNGGTYLGQTTTGTPRPDVINAFSLDPAALPGWTYTMPNSVFDGEPHTLFAESVDLGSTTQAFLNPTAGKSFQGATP